MGGIAGSAGNTGRSTSGDESFDPKPNGVTPTQISDGLGTGNPEGGGNKNNISRSGPGTFGGGGRLSSVPDHTNTEPAPAPKLEAPPPLPVVAPPKLPDVSKADMVKGNAQRDISARRDERLGLGSSYGRRGTLLTGLLGLSDANVSSTKKSLLGI